MLLPAVAAAQEYVVFGKFKTKYVECTTADSPYVCYAIGTKGRTYKDVAKLSPNFEWFKEKNQLTGIKPTDPVETFKLFISQVRRT